MQKKLLGALVIGTMASGALAHQPLARPDTDWRPVTRGLTQTPDRLLPAVISPTHPVRVVSTALDHTGRPVVTTRTATDRAAAARLVAAGQRAANAIGVELDAPVATAVELDGLVTSAGTDPYRDQQWDLDIMRAAEAWPRATGAGVTVAVIDTGVDAGHPDLAGQVLPGADFITGAEGVSTDPNGHGTHVAGTIAALAGNGVGIAGTAPDARILPVRVLGANGGGYMSDVANGIVYAADHGADVINMSVSATSQVDAVTNAVAYARSRGVVVVAAAGNLRGSGSPTSYPAADPGVLAVGATDPGDRVASYSSQGGYVDVAAPGSDILSTVPPATGVGYRRMSGTSMAAPHVAAVAALLKSADRGLTPDRIEQAIEESAADLGAPGRDDDFGFGRVDAAAALATTAPPPPAEEQPTTPTTPADEQPATPPAPADEQPTASEPPATTEPTPDPTAPEESPTAPGESPAPSEPAPSPPPLSPSTPEETTEPTTPPSPTTPEETTEPTTNPTNPDETPAPTVTPLGPTLTRPPSGPPRARIIRTGPQQLTAVLEGLDGQPAEVQRKTGGGWTTVTTYPATLAARINGLATGATYRVLVPASDRSAGAVSADVRM